MTVEIKGLDKTSKYYRTMVKQIPFASMLTLNDLAFDSLRALNKEIENKMKVRKNTAKAFAVDKAKKTDLVATIRMKKDWHWLVLKHHYYGGESEQIGFEREMIKRGYMTDNHSAIPIKKMGKARYKTILNASRPSLKNNKYFVVKTKNKNKRSQHLAPGIYQRLKRKVKPIILFTQEAQYRKRFDMFATVEKVVNRRAEKYFFTNMEKAMKTAR